MAEWLEKSIATISPSWAAKRAKSRAILQAYGKARGIQARYEGASRGRRMDGWRTVSSGSANAEIGPALSLLRNRARDLSRNTWVGRRAASVIVHNTIGTGIRPSMDGDSEAERMIKAWARSTECDADGMYNLYGLQALMWRTRFEGGEALIVRELQPFSTERIPIKIRVLEGDYLDESYSETLQNGNQVVQGVEFDRHGRRVAYHLFYEHPGDSLAYGYNHERRRVPAEDVIHLMKADRPGQVRGVTDFAPVIVKLREWDSYEDAQLVRQKIASCFTAFVRTNSGMMPGENKSNDDRPLGEKMMPGIIEILRPGEDVTFGNPPDVGGYKEYADVTLHEIAAGLDISYEALTGDLKGVSFSAGRMGWLEFQRKIESDRKLVFEPQVLHRVADWLLDMLFIMGKATGNEVVKWTPPRREMIDPVKETNAAIAAVLAGFDTRQSVIRSLGRDPEEVLKEHIEDRDNADENDLFFASDPRFRNMPEGLLEKIMGYGSDED